MRESLDRCLFQLAVISFYHMNKSPFLKSMPIFTLTGCAPHVGVIGGGKNGFADSRPAVHTLLLQP